MVSGAISAFFSYSRKNYRLAVASAILSTLFGLSVWFITLIAPRYQLEQSLLYYFLPLFLPPLVGTMLLLHKKGEFTR